MEPNLTWQVLYTMPRAEKKVYSELEKLHCDVYLPMVKVVRQWSDRRKKLLLPLFPSYIFVNARTSNRAEILRLPGVIKFLVTNGRPDEISQREINLIRQVVEHNPQVACGKFNVGDSVKFTSGPLIGIEGTLVNINGKRKFSVYLNALGKSLLVETNPGSLALK